MLSQGAWAWTRRSLGSSRTLVRSGDGGTSITICEDRAGTEESSRRAADWVRQTVPAAAGNPPEISEGEVLYQFGR